MVLQASALREYLNVSGWFTLWYYVFVGSKILLRFH